MLELNGELVMPKDLPTTDDGENDSASELLGNRVELGSLRFTEEVSEIMGTIIVQGCCVLGCYFPLDAASCICSVAKYWFLCICLG